MRKWGHPRFFLSKLEHSCAFLTVIELRRLDPRFVHPTADRLYRLAGKARHSGAELQIIETITKFCHHCQMHGQAPRGFKFTLHDDCNFNFDIIMDVMYRNKRRVLHVVDSATSFQGARFLTNISAKETW